MTKYSDVLMASGSSITQLSPRVDDSKKCILYFRNNDLIVSIQIYLKGKLGPCKVQIYYFLLHTTSSLQHSR